jgi:periplasmic protein TonB
MAFADETPNNRKMVSFGLVVLLHSMFAWLFVSGLAVKAFKAVTGPIEILDVKEPPPEEEPPPPPEKLEDIPPYVPPPEVNVDLPPPPVTQAPVIVQQTVPQPEPRVVQAPPPPPPPPPKAIVRVNINSADLAKQLSRKARPEFPSSVSRQMEADGVTESKVRCEVFVAESGKVEDARCDGGKYPALAERSVRWLKGFKFPPATEDGRPLGSWVSLPVPITWRLEE